MVYAFCIGATVSTGFALLITHLIPIQGFWNICLGILVYLLINALIHWLFELYCKPYLSSNTPKHLIIISSGHIGHYSRCKGYKDAFEYYHKTNPDINKDDIMVYLSRNNHNGFFFYTLYKTNDGINKGGIRLSDEIKDILIEYPSITKLSVIGCSLGGLYCRYALSLLFDSQNESYINGKKYDLMNFITLATPHQGVKDWTGVDRFCGCCCFTYHKLAEWMNNFCWNKISLVPLTLQQLMFLDKYKLLIRMATDDKYLCPLQLFKNKICFGNAKHDAVVKTTSSLLLNGDREAKNAENFWDKMVEDENEELVEEFKLNEDEKENDNDRNDDGDELDRLRIDVEWKKMIVCWNQNFVITKASHAILAGPPFWYKGAKHLFQTLNDNFVY